MSITAAEIRDFVSESYPYLEEVGSLGLLETYENKDLTELEREIETILLNPGSEIELFSSEDDIVNALNNLQTKIESEREGGFKKPNQQPEIMEAENVLDVTFNPDEYAREKAAKKKRGKAFRVTADELQPFGLTEEKLIEYKRLSEAAESKRLQEKNSKITTNNLNTLAREELDDLKNGSTLTTALAETSGMVGLSTGSANNFISAYYAKEFGRYVGLRPIIEHLARKYANKKTKNGALELASMRFLQYLNRLNQIKTRIEKLEKMTEEVFERKVANSLVKSVYERAKARGTAENLSAPGIDESVAERIANKLAEEASVNNQKQINEVKENAAKAGTISGGGETWELDE